MGRLPKQPKFYSTLLVAIVVVVTLLFAVLSLTSKPEVEEAKEQPVGMDAWTIEQSALNGAPLAENKNIYKLDDAGNLDTLYITVFPTKTENGILDFSAFDLHTARDQTYDPTLEANVVQGDKDGRLSPLVNTDVVNASIRVRGNSSRGALFKSYKIRFSEEGDNFRGMTVLNLNKHMNDISKVAQKFCFDLMRDIDNFSSLRTNFVKVYIRDASLPPEEQQYRYYGLHTNVEQPNKAYLTAHGLDINASLYKATQFEFRESPELKNVDDPAYDEVAFETILGIREGKDHTKLLNMLRDINDMSGNFEENFHKYFNEDNYLTWLAVNILLGNEDTISHNFILYNPNNSMTWYLMPWDYDGTFAFGEYKGSFKAPESLRGIQRMTGVQLHRRYFINPNNIKKLEAKVEYILNTYFTKERVNGLLEQYKPVLEQTMTLAPDVGVLEMPPNELGSYLAQFHDVIMNNYRAFVTALEYPTPVFTSEPQKTDDGVKFAWEASRDFDNELVKYSIRVARNYQMTDIVFEADELLSTVYTFKGDLEGDYFMEVKSIDSSGHRQYSLDSYEDVVDRTFTNGVRKFTIK
ncbi:MAG: CotH kinase family protein [Angelakisella sp.]